MQVLSSSPDGRTTAPGGPERFSSPLVFLWAMLVFLALTGFVAMILGRQVIQAFTTNPGLNGLILGVLAVGILLAVAQILRLAREARWLNALRDNDRERRARSPILLAPMEAMIGQGAMPRTLPAPSVRAVLDSVGGRLDESRRNGATLPVTALVDQFYAEVQAMGGGRQDTSALVRRIKQ